MAGAAGRAAQRSAHAKAQAHTQAQAAAAPAATPAADDVISQLERLAALKASGVLSDEEFATAKTKLLS